MTSDRSTHLNKAECGVVCLLQCHSMSNQVSVSSPSMLFFFLSRPLRYLVTGAVSISLTLLNIVSVYLVAIIMFKIKEVAPIQGGAVRE